MKYKDKKKTTDIEREYTSKNEKYEEKINYK